MVEGLRVVLQRKVDRSLGSGTINDDTGLSSVETATDDEYAITIIEFLDTRHESSRKEIMSLFDTYWVNELDAK